MGHDADAPMARGEVGKVGVSISSLRDMETLLQDIPLNEVSTSMTINAPAALLLLLYELVAEQQGVSPERLQGTVQNDILKEYAARGTYIFPPRPSMRLTTDLFAYCKQRLPSWNTISISGYHLREAGATAVQELGFTMAHAIAYVDAARAAGLEVAEFAPRLSFFFAVFSDFFEEVAKFRAARTIWARLMMDRYGVKDGRAQALRFHTQTGGSTLTAQQPYNNIVRVALQAMSAVLGGTQSLHANSFAEAVEEGRGAAGGVNRFTGDDDAGEIVRIGPKPGRERLEAFRRLRAERDGARVEAHLAEVRRAAEGSANLLPPMRDALKAYATIGEVCGVLRDVFGEYRPGTRS